MKQSQSKTNSPKSARRERLELMVESINYQIKKPTYMPQASLETSDEGLEIITEMEEGTSQESLNLS